MISTTLPERLIRVVSRFGLIAALGAVAASATSSAWADRSGSWQFRSTSETPEIEISFKYEGATSRHWGSTEVRIGSLDGLDQAQLEATPSRASFRLVREAGVFHLVGRVGRGEGSGTWRFAAAPEFARTLVRRGFERPTEEQQLSLALHDAGVAMIEELAAQKYQRPTTSELVWMAQHGVNLAYLRHMGALGYRVEDPALLVRMCDHGVDPAFVEAFHELGYKALSVNELVELRDHGVTPEFASEIAAAGFPGLAPEQLRRMRDHGVDGRYIRRAKARLRGRVTIEDVIELRDRGVRL